VTRVFSAPLEEFQRKLLTNDLFRELERTYPTIVGRTPAPSEAGSWRASLPRLEAIIRLAQLPPSVYVTLEEGIPYFSKRIDVCLFGHTAEGLPHVVVIELKGWTAARALDTGNVETILGGARRETLHPSAQVFGYQEHLEDFRRAFQGNGRIGLASCAYCHNYPGIIPDEGLFHPQFDRLRIQSPTFGEGDASTLSQYLQVRLKRGHGDPVLEAYDQSGIGPSKSLIDNAGKAIREQNVFRLLDDQLAASNEILHAVERAAKRGQKQVILVRGGPGTGKSVVALNVLGEMIRLGLTVNLVTGSSAFTHGMRSILGKRLEGQIRFTDYFWNAQPESIDVLVVDEAHRIRTKSEPRVPSALRPKGHQVDELIRASRLTVFMLDENQIISPKEVGEPALVEAAAARQGATFRAFHLKGQFRCNGSSSYLDWLDDVLALTPECLGLKLVTPVGFDLKIVDSPHALLQEVRDINRGKPNTARILAGWCWPWSDPLPNRLVEDIQIGDFRFPWEAKSGKRPPPGIPEAKHWAIDPCGVNQAGTVYSVQGFETDHVGVIIGPDLVVREKVWIAQPSKNYSNDLRRQSPLAALPYLKRIYRTLLSRPMRSCSIYCIDPETRSYLEGQLISP
jgi:uncharacterized protein